jgi:flavin reductase (DIM6/NTAB) family NADH-FMN oxidoreductase RutF
MALTDVARIFEQSLDPPLWLLTAAHGAERAGLIATFVANASLVPELPRVVVGLARHHHTWGVVERARCFALHLLDESHLDWVPRFGIRSGHEGDKFAGLDLTAGTTGSPILPGALACLECRVESALDTGDRTFYLAEIVQADAGRTGKPLTTSHMLRSLGDEQRHQLRDRLQHDIQLDAAAIRAWRARQG